MSNMVLELMETLNMGKVYFLKKIPKNNFKMNRFQNVRRKVYEIHFHVVVYNIFSNLIMTRPGCVSEFLMLTLTTRHGNQRDEWREIMALYNLLTGYSHVSHHVYYE